MTLDELRGHKVGICVSGGLDSKTVTHAMLSAGVDVLCFTADLGQPDEDDIGAVAQRMAPTGARTVIVDLRDAMAQACFDAIRAQACYDGGYRNSTGLGRAVMVNGLVTAMRDRGCDVLAHGATGRGNDQVRIERYVNVLDPQMLVYAPWRDPQLLSRFPGRKQMRAYLREHGIESADVEARRYSTDANLAGLSHEAEDLEDLLTPCNIVEPVMGVWPQDAPDRIETVKLQFSKGNCVAINATRLTPLEAMCEANAIAGRNGIWMRNALENRIIGTKSRGVYEAPGMELLGYALSVVYQATLDRDSSALFEELSQLAGRQLYDGRWFDPATTAAMTAIDYLADSATGTVELELYKGNMYFKSLSECPASLYSAADASMEASEGLNPVSAQGFTEIQSVEAKALARAGRITPR